MKKSIFGTLAAALMAVAVFTSCNKSEQANAAQEQESTTNSTLKIAYVEVDSIMTQYQFCKEYSLELQKKGQNIQNTLAQKQQQLQNAVVNFQQNLEQNKYTREQAEAIQANLQKQDNDLQALNQRLSNEFQLETNQFNNALRDSLQHYLAVYNKDKNYTLILSKVGDNLLYADKAYDITNEIIAGLNKAYKPAAKKAEKKEPAKEEKK